jgi:hypothetical protein
MLIALVRSAVLYKGWFRVERDPGYLTSAGVLLILAGALYTVWALVVSSERPTFLVMRRELASFFYSPILYILIIIGCVIPAWFRYYDFVDIAQRMTQMRRPMIEPIIRDYMLNWEPIFFFIVAVPLLSMRLFSEEERSGTMEMLMTAPVEGTAVVLGKFFASLTVFILAWMPYGLYLIALRVESGQPFDYRPLVSFSVGLFCSAAGALAVGCLASSLTRHQLGAFIITFMAMLVWTFAHIFRDRAGQWSPYLSDLLGYISYIDLWDKTLNGRIAPSYILFHISAAVFWLFLTVKVLESRKWR